MSAATMYAIAAILVADVGDRQSGWLKIATIAFAASLALNATVMTIETWLAL